MCYRIKAADGVVFGCSSCSCVAIVVRLHGYNTSHTFTEDTRDTMYYIYIRLRCAEFNTVLSSREKGESTTSFRTHGQTLAPETTVECVQSVVIPRQKYTPLQKYIGSYLSSSVLFSYDFDWQCSSWELKEFLRGNERGKLFQSIDQCDVKKGRLSRTRFERHCPASKIFFIIELVSTSKSDSQRMFTSRVAVCVQRP